VSISSSLRRYCTYISRITPSTELRRTKKRRPPSSAIIAVLSFVPFHSLTLQPNTLLYKTATMTMMKLFSSALFYAAIVGSTSNAFMGTKLVISSTSSPRQMASLNMVADDAKVILVTGSSRGLGKSIALDLGSHGQKVVVNYVSDGSKAGADETCAAKRREGMPLRCKPTVRAANTEEEVNCQVTFGPPRSHVSFALCCFLSLFLSSTNSFETRRHQIHV